MKPATKPVFDDTQSIQLLPSWVTSSRSEAIETVAFTSGAALALLDVMLRDLSGTLPGALLRDRMALDAAVASVWRGQGMRWDQPVTCLLLGAGCRGLT